MDDCVFCKIVKGEIPSSKVYEDDKVLAFKDINPIAPVHVLVIPKKHISSLNDVNSDNSELIAHVFEVISKIAKELGIDKEGFRVISNCGEAAGQTVPHIHFHLLAKTKFTWPQ